MIKLTEEVQIKFDENVVAFEKYLFELYYNSKLMKQKFISTEFNSLASDTIDKNVSSFLVQFIPFINYLIFFPDDEKVLSKLNELGFDKSPSTSMVRLEEIEKEIKRLSNIDGLLIFPFHYLVASIHILQLKFNIEFIERLGLSCTYNNSKTNPLFVDTSNRLRRREYNEEKIHETEIKDSFELMMNAILDYSDNVSIKLGLEKEALSKNYLQMLKGNVKIYTDLFNQFYCLSISKSRAYSELFPLLKLILKDAKLMSEKEYFDNDNDKFYDGKYEFYKISRVRKILLKK